MRFHPAGLAFLLGLLVSPVSIVVTLLGPGVWNSVTLIDAASFRNGAQFVGTPDLYNVDAYVAVQKQEFPAPAAYRQFLRPPWYATAVGWLADMPYRAAMNAWRIAMAGMALLFIAAWPSRFRAALAICWSIPLLSAMLQGQDDGVLLSAMAFSLLLLRHERNVLAGVVLSICAIKPHLFIFIPIALVAARKSRIGLGLAAGLGLQMVISFVVQGAAWPVDYLRVILSGGPSDAFTNGVSLINLFKEIGPGAELTASILFIAAGGVYVFRLARTAPFTHSLCVAVATAVITSPHAFLQDMLLVVPLALLSLDIDRLWKRSLALFFLSSAWAVGYHIAAAQGPSVSYVATLLAVLPVIGLIVLTPRTVDASN